MLFRSKNDSHLYLVGERTTTPAKNHHTFDTSVFDSTQMDPWMAVNDRGVSGFNYRMSYANDNPLQTWKEFRWNALEKLSRITKFSRDAAGKQKRKQQMTDMINLWIGSISWCLESSCFSSIYTQSSSSITRSS